MINWCDVCGTEHETPMLHHYHNAMILDGTYTTRVCLGCACSNPDAVSKDGCYACQKVLARMIKNTGRP